MRYVILLAAALAAAAPCHADSFVLTQIRLTWPLDQVGNPFRIATGPDAYVEFATSTPLDVHLDVLPTDSAAVAAFVADLTDGTLDDLTFSIGSFTTTRPESFFFGDFDVADGTGMRRLDYATQVYPAQVTGVDWSNFEIHGFDVSAVGPLSLNPDRGRVVVDVLCLVPESSTSLLLAFALSTAGWWPCRRHWQ